MLMLLWTSKTTHSSVILEPIGLFFPSRQMFPVPQTTTQRFINGPIDNVWIRILTFSSMLYHLHETQDVKKKKLVLKTFKVRSLPVCRLAKHRKARRPQVSITSQRNRTFKDFHIVKKQAREFTRHPASQISIWMKYNPSFSCPCTDEWLQALYSPREVGLCAAQRFIFWWGYFKVSGV